MIRFGGTKVDRLLGLDSLKPPIHALGVTLSIIPNEPGDDVRASQQGVNERSGNVMSNGALLDIKQLAIHFNTGERFIRRLVAERRITYTKIGRLIRFRAEDVKAFEDAGARPRRQDPRGNRHDRA